MACDGPSVVLQAYDPSIQKVGRQEDCKLSLARLRARELRWSCWPSTCAHVHTKVDLSVGVYKVDARDPGSGLHASAVDTLPTDLSPSPILGLCFITSSEKLGDSSVGEVLTVPA